MINSKEQQTLRETINKAFENLPEKEREEMFNELVNQPGAYTAFGQMIGDKIAKVGVKIKIGRINSRYYFPTEHDSELLDM